MMYESISFGVTRRSDFDYVRKLAEKDKLELSDDEQEVLDLVNKYRKENGLDELIMLYKRKSPIFDKEKNYEYYRQYEELKKLDKKQKKVEFNPTFCIKYYEFR